MVRIVFCLLLYFGTPCRSSSSLQCNHHLGGALLHHRGSNGAKWSKSWRNCEHLQQPPGARLRENGLNSDDMKLFVISLYSVGELRDQLGELEQVVVVLPGLLLPARNLPLKLSWQRRLSRASWGSCCCELRHTPYFDTLIRTTCLHTLLFSSSHTFILHLLLLLWIRRTSYFCSYFYKWQFNTIGKMETLR